MEPPSPPAIGRRGDPHKAASIRAPTSVASASINNERDHGHKLAFGSSLFQDARSRSLPGSGSPLHLAQDSRGPVAHRSDRERPRCLFRHDRTPEGGGSRGAAGPYLLGHGGRLI